MYTTIFTNKNHAFDVQYDLRKGLGGVRGDYAAIQKCFKIIKTILTNLFVDCEDRKLFLSDKQLKFKVISGILSESLWEINIDNNSMNINVDLRPVHSIDTNKKDELVEVIEANFSSKCDRYVSFRFST